MKAVSCVGDVGEQHWREGALAVRPSDALANIFNAERDAFFLWSPVCLGAGIALYFALPFEPQLYACLAPLAAALFLRLLTTRGSLIGAVANALVLVALGFGLTKLRVETVRAPVLAKALHNVEVKGVVMRAEPKPPRGQRLTIAVESIERVAANDTPAVITLRTMSGRTTVGAGDRVRVKATMLAAPSRPALPGGFDYARLAWFNRLGGVGFGYGAPIVEGVSKAGDVWSLIGFAIEDLRQRINVRIHAALPGENGAIAAALITGERGGISTETNSAFKNSGLFHILSISGLHMVIAAGAVFYVTRLLLAAIPALALTLPIKKIAALTGIVSAIGYLSISGGAFATVRSALMILIMFGAVMMDRPALALRNVAIAAFIILMLYPESLLDAGFQMSFAAVTALIASHEAVSRRLNVAGPGFGGKFMRFFAEIIASTLIASAAVAPFAAFQFHQSQQYAVLANMMAIPICNFIVMPAALFAMVLMPLGFEQLGLMPMGLGIEAMKWCASAVAALPGSVGYIPAFPTIAFALMLTGGMWLALLQTRLRLAGALLVIAGLALTPFMPRPDVIVAQNGRLVAVRGASGRLEALASRQSKFEVERWLEYDGDGRTAGEAQRAEAFKCDAVGCVARVKDAVVAVARSPAAIDDDCARADILVLDMPRPRDCKQPTRILDVFDIWRDGNAALYFQGRGEDGAPRVRVETVAAARGERPWSMPPLNKRGHGRSELPVPSIVPAITPQEPVGEPASGKNTSRSTNSSLGQPSAVSPIDKLRSAQSEDPAEEPSEDTEAGDLGDAQ